MKKLITTTIVLVFLLIGLKAQVCFTPVWSGNGLNQMNFYILGATVNGVNMMAGDEIGIFDGTYCVGVGVLTQELTGLPLYLSIKASEDDTDTPEKDGFTAGNPITYRLCTDNGSVIVTNVGVVYDPPGFLGLFSGSGTAVAYLSGTTECINPPTLNLSSSIGSTCVDNPVTISGNTFSNANTVTITDNGAGLVLPSSVSSSPFSFTYTPDATDLGNTVTITLTTDNPEGDPCVTDTETFTLTVNPLPGAAETITGTSTVCQGQSGLTYIVPAIADATGYVWSFSGAGATINGTSNSITIDFAGNATTGNLTVYGTNTCGNGTVSASYPITINANVTPTFTQLGPYCVGATPGTLPTTSLNGITGTWSPTTISTVSAGSTVYTFTPSVGQCGTTTTMTVVVNANVTPTFTQLGPYCVGATPGTLPTTSLNGITGTWSPTTISTVSAGSTVYTFTPSVGQCGTTTTMTVVVNANVTPTFTQLGPYCVGATPGTLPTTSLNGITGTWSPTTISTVSAGSTVYTFTPSVGQCGTTTTMTVVVNANVTPTFTQLGPYCVGATPGTLPTTSLNGITGTWSPTTISTVSAGSTVYTFTPSVGQCGTTTTMTVVVNANVTPTFTQLGPYCVGATPGTLPTTSLNGITGTWSPTTISTVSAGSTVYTFTPSVGQCGTTTTMTVVVNANVTPTFTQLGPYCVGATPGTLPTTSLNGITGTWSPTTISTVSAGSTVYTFTPSVGQCGTTTTMTVVVNANVTPTFTQLGPYCVGATPGTLPTTSLNGITGTWSPTTISTVSAGSTVYTFTPSEPHQGHCRRHH